MNIYYKCGDCSIRTEENIRRSPEIVQSGRLNNTRETRNVSMYTLVHRSHSLQIGLVNVVAGNDRKSLEVKL